MSESLVGRQGAPFHMVVERGKIREFARATKSSNPDYLEGDHPLSPVTFLSVVGLLAGRVEFPLG